MCWRLHSPPELISQTFDGEHQCSDSSRAFSFCLIACGQFLITRSGSGRAAGCQFSSGSQVLLPPSLSFLGPLGGPPEGPGPGPTSPKGFKCSPLTPCPLRLHRRSQRHQRTEGIRHLSSAVNCCPLGGHTAFRAL